MSNVNNTKLHINGPSGHCTQLYFRNVSLDHSDQSFTLCNLPSFNVLCFSGGGDKTIRVWQLDTGYCAAVLTGHNDAVTCLTLDSGAGDMQRIISGSLDRTIKVSRSSFSNVQSVCGSNLSKPFSQEEH